MAAANKVSILDLTVAQVEQIETSIGLPVSRWGEAPSQANLYVRILAAATGESEDRYRAMTLRALVDLVSLDGNADPNP